MNEENQTDYALLPPDGDGERSHSNNNEDDLNNVEHNKKMLEKFDNMLQMNEDELL